jgi:GntR family transcriptional regulator, transcriptional repressor for pyruvate dehydrogenase complex
MSGVDTPGPLAAASPPTDVWLAVELVRQGDEAVETLPEQIARRIAGMIERGELGPGTRLPSERDLARIFGVSRLAVREAAHRLEARQLVVIRRGAGSFVTAPAGGHGEAAEGPVASTVDLQELFDVRMLLEPAAADWAARRADRLSAGVLLRLAALFEDAVGSAEPRFDLLATADAELHLEVARCADNAVLTKLLAQLQDLQRLQLEWTLRRPGRLEETAAEHRRVVDAIAAGDPAAARDAMADHLAAAAVSFQALAGEGGPD